MPPFLVSSTPTALDPNIWLPEIIRIAPSILLVILLIGIVFYFRKNLRNVIDRLSVFDGFGLKMSFSQAQEQLRQAIASYPIKSVDGQDIDKAEIDRIVRHADRIRSSLYGARILWVDDTPLANATIFRFLNDYGIVIDVARSTKEALEALQWAADAYEVFVTDMKREEHGQDRGRAGIEFIQGVRKLKIQKDIIVFVAILDPTPKPEGSRLITNNVPDLITEIFNVIEMKHPPKT